MTALGINDINLVFWSLCLALLAVGAPGSYALIGAMLGKRIESPKILKNFSLAMAALLVGVALSIGHEHVWLPLVARYH